MPSFYIPEFSRADKKLKVSGEEFHHAIKVRRLNKGDQLSVTNGKGLLASGMIKNITKRDFEIQIDSIKEEIISNPKVAVGFSLLKNKHDHLIIEKLTELGIKEFFPVITDRSVRLPNKNYLEKFEKVAIAAIKQCDNAYLPKINSAMKLKEFCSYLDQNGYEALFALESGENNLLDRELNQIESKDICFIIGPEGGFSEAEIAYIKEKGFKTITLGNHVLRAETAAIATAAQILNHYLLRNNNYY